MPDMHEIDYKIFGDDMQFVEVELDPNEATVAEAGGMMYMDDGIEMETIFGDGSQQQGGVPRRADGRRQAAADRRVAVHDRLPQPQRRRRSRSPSARRIPGKIVAIHLAEIGGELIAQKDSFLAAAKGVSIGIAFQTQARRRPVRRRGLHHAAAAGRRLGVRPRRRHAARADARARRS